MEDSESLSNSMQSWFICFPKSYMYVREGLTVHYMHYCKHYMWLWREGQNLWFFTYLGRSQRALVFNQEINLNRILRHFDLVFDVDLLPSAYFVEFFFKSDLIKDSSICLGFKKTKRSYGKPGKLQL